MSKAEKNMEELKDKFLSVPHILKALAEDMDYSECLA